MCRLLSKLKIWFVRFRPLTIFDRPYHSIGLCWNRHLTGNLSERSRHRSWPGEYERIYIFLRADSPFILSPVCRDMYRSVVEAYSNGSMDGELMKRSSGSEILGICWKVSNLISNEDSEDGYLVMGISPSTSWFSMRPCIPGSSSTELYDIPSHPIALIDQPRCISCALCSIGVLGERDRLKLGGVQRPQASVGSR